MVPESFTHGTSAQRQRWFRTGLQDRQRQGLRHLQRARSSERPPAGSPGPESPVTGRFLQRVRQSRVQMTDASFSNLSLAEPLARAVAEMGYETMTPIQAQAIPVVLTGKDVMGAAQTGTGKTAAFSLPLLQRMLKHENASTSPARHPVRALVLLPTRELADQVAQQVKLYAKYTNLRSAVVFGGIDMKPQTAELKKGVEVLVATPGRLLDHIEAKNAVLNQVEYVVLDEADRMLDIGFLPDLQRILSYLPKQRTTLLFSATFSPEIKRLANSYLQDPVTIEVARPERHGLHGRAAFLQRRRRRQAPRRSSQIVRQRGIKQAFVFVNSKLGCARLARSLEREGLKTTALHGDKSQDERLKALDAFKAGEVDLLVATDVAARGLDIKDVPAVFNFDVPFNAEDYVHRIGRTGRAGASGLAVTLVSRQRRAAGGRPREAAQEARSRLEADRVRRGPAARPHQRRPPRLARSRRGWAIRATCSTRPRAAARRAREARARRRRRATRSSTSPTRRPTSRRRAGLGSAAKPAASRISANIKPKRKVAALFKQPLAATARVVPASAGDDAGSLARRLRLLALHLDQFARPCRRRPSAARSGSRPRRSRCPATMQVGPRSSSPASTSGRRRSACPRSRGPARRTRAA